MISIKNTLVESIKKNPIKFFLMMSIANGYFVFLSYFIKNDFFPEMDFNVFYIIFIMGVVLTFFLMVIYLALNNFLNKVMVPKETQSKCNTLFVLSAILWCGLILPSRAVTFLKLGNYTGTLILKQEGVRVFSDFPKITFQSKNIIKNLHVVWSSGKRWFFMVPVDNKSSLMDINSEFIYDIIKNGKNSVEEDIHRLFIGD